MPEQRVDETDGGRRDAELRMIGAESFRDFPRVGGFVVRRVALEADAEGLDGLARQAGHDADHDRRVDTAAQKCPQGHVADQSPLDGPRRVSGRDQRPCACR